jgi:RimJ/RimL family protein N-acetyltransferase
MPKELDNQMFTLNKNDYLKVAPLYADVTNSKPVVFSVIESNTEGTITIGDKDKAIYVDDDINPQTALVNLYDMFFLNGKTNRKFCESIYDLIVDKILPSMQGEYFDLYCLSDGLRVDVEEIFAPIIYDRLVRKTFTFDYKAFKQHSHWREQIPEGFEVSISKERFGVELVRQGNVISDCSAVFVGGGQAEIAVETNEKYRKQGFATLTCAAFIEHCFSRGYVPNWTCWDFREGSAELAKKLGFFERSNDIVYLLKKAVSF